jgi:Tol biopolymer transport system component
MRSRLVSAALATAALGLAAPAHGALVYTKVGSKGSVWIADNDGANARKLAGNAGLAQLSPDGQSVAYVSKLYSEHPSISIKPAAGGEARTLVENWGFLSAVWSSDNRHLLVITQASFKSSQRLKLVDTVSGQVTTLAKGYFSDMDFSPLGDQVVYGRAKSQKSFPSTDLYIVPAAGGETRKLTDDGHSLNPKWGAERIAYSRYKRPTGKHRNDDGPKYNLFLIDPATGLRTQLTHDKVPYLLTGLTPAAWSIDGTKLLGSFGGQDTWYGVRIDPATGDQRKLRKVGKLPVEGTALSADGLTVLGYTGYADSFEGDVVTQPWAGGPSTVLVKHAIDPDWTG